MDTELRELLLTVRGLASEIIGTDWFFDIEREGAVREYIDECADKIIEAIDEYNAAALPVPVTPNGDGPADYCAAGVGA